VAVIRLIVYYVNLYGVSKKQIREMETRKRKNRNILKTIAIALATLVMVLAIAYLVLFSSSKASPIWHVEDSGLLAFDARPPVVANSTNLEATQNWTLEKISYKSFGDDVYALLRIPANVSRPPVVIVLPGAGVNKEADAGMAEALASWGYATLTLDERGNNGETAGPSPMDIRSGLNAYVNGGDPVQYRQIYDVLLGYDYVRSRADLDGSNVSALGESMGGRFAIIATALEPGLKAAIGVSTGPYGLQADSDSSVWFYMSIEPASYLSSLPPRELIMFHFTGDKIIPVESARLLYDAAKGPKSWHEYEGDVHGVYSSVYAPDLHEELKGVFGR
jgi:dienelactone hydrolase